MTLAELLVSLKFNSAEWQQDLAAARSSWDSFTEDLMKGGAALSAVFTAPLGALGKMALEMGHHFESAEVGFATMMGSAEDAKSMLEDLRDFAAKTPFEFKDLVTAAKRMMALGFAADDIIPSLRAIGNAAAGLGGSADLIQRLILALGQMRAKGKLSAEEMRQLAEAGIPAWDMVAKKIGVDIPTAMKKAEAGAISATVAIPAIIEGMNAKFGGLMENFNKTAMGQFSNLKDNLGFILADIGKSIMPLASLFIERFLIPASEKLKALAEAFVRLPDSIKMATILFAALLSVTGPLMIAFGAMAYGATQLGSALIGISGAVSWFIGAIGNVATAVTTGMAGALTTGEVILGAFALTAATVGAAVGAAWLLWQIPETQKLLVDFGKTLSDFWTGDVWPSIKAAADTIKSFGEDFMTVAGNLLKTGMDILFKNIKEAADVLRAKWEELTASMIPLSKAWEDLQKACEPVEPMLRKLWAAFVDLQKTVAGGILIFFMNNLANAVLEVFKAVNFLIGIFVTTWTGAMKLGAAGISYLAEVIRTSIIPALEWATLGLVKFLEWISQIPGVKETLTAVGFSFDNLREKIKSFWADMSKKSAPIAKVDVSGLEAAQKALEQSIKTRDELLAKMSKLDSKSKEYQDASLQLAGAVNAVTNAEKKRNDEIEKAGLGMDTVRAALKAARAESAAAATSLAAVTKGLKDGTSTGADYAAAVARSKDASEKLAKANELVRAAAKASGKEVAEYTKEIEKTVPKAVSLADANKQMADAAKELKLQQEELIRVYLKADDANKSATTALRDAELGMRAGSVSVLEYEAAQKKAANAGKALEAIQARLIDISTKLQAAEDKLHPEKVLQRQAEGTETYNKLKEEEIKKQEELVKAIEHGNATLLSQESALTSAATAMVKAYGQAYDDLVKKYAKPIPAPSLGVMQNQIDLTGGILIPTPGLQWVNEAVEKYKWQQEVGESAYKAVGVASSNSFQQQVYNAKWALGVVAQLYKDGLASWLDYLHVKQRELEAEAAYEMATYGRVSDELKKKLKENEAAIKAHTKNVKSYWDKLVEDIGQVFKGIGRQLGSGLFDIILGSDRKEYNKRLEQEIKDLEKSIADRTKEWEKYQADIAAQMDQAVADHAASLRKEESDLQKSLDDRAKQHEEYNRNALAELQQFREDSKKELDSQVADLMATLEMPTETPTYTRGSYEQDQEALTRGLEEFTKANRESLDQELADLQANLNERVAEYDQYVTDVVASYDSKRQELKASYDQDLRDLQVSLAEQEDEYAQYALDINRQAQDVTAEHKYQLDQKLDDLARSLDDERSKYEEFVSDVNMSLSRLGEDYQDSIEDETKSVNKGMADKKRQYDRDVEDANRRIAELRRTGGKGAAQEISDLKLALKRKKEDLDSYNQDAQDGLAEYIEEARTKYQREEQDLRASLEKRQQEWRTYQNENKRLIDASKDESSKSLEKELNDLRKNLTKKTDELLKFREETKAKQNELAANYESNLAEEYAKLQANVAAKGGELEKYRTETIAKMASITAAHDAELKKEEERVAAAMELNTAAYEAYKESIVGPGGKIDQLNAEYAKKIADKEAETKAGLDAEEADYAAYVESITGPGGKFEQVRAANAASLAAELVDLQNNLRDKKAEYDAYIAEITGPGGKLDQIREQFRTFGGDLGELLSDIFKGAASAISGAIVGGLFDKMWEDIEAWLKSLDIGGDLYNGLKKIGSGLVDVFKGVWEVMKDIGGLVWDAVKAIGGVIPGISNLFSTGASAASGAASAASGAAGAAGSVASGAGGIASGVSGALAQASAITGIVTGGISAVTGIISAFQQGSMNDKLKFIAQSTFQTANQLIYGIQPQLNENLPGITSLNDRIVQIMQNGLGIYVQEGYELFVHGLDTIQDMIGNLTWDKTTQSTNNILGETKDYARSVDANLVGMWANLASELSMIYDSLGYLANMDANLTSMSRSIALFPVTLAPPKTQQVLQANITVQMDGRTVGNSIIQNLALQGVRA